MKHDSRSYVRVRKMLVYWVYWLTHAEMTKFTLAINNCQIMSVLFQVTVKHPFLVNYQTTKISIRSKAGFTSFFVDSWIIMYVLTMLMYRWNWSVDYCVGVQSTLLMKMAEVTVKRDFDIFHMKKIGYILQQIKY